MSIGRPEKIGAHERPGKWKREAKRALTKKLRIEAKRDPENAPRRAGHYGWST